MLCRTIRRLFRSPRKKAVYLLLGQSNMVGAQDGGTQLLPEHPRIKMLDLRNNIVSAKNPLHGGPTVYPEIYSTESNGLGLPFAHEMIDSTNHEIILVPSARGGSPMNEMITAPTKNFLGSTFVRSLLEVAVERVKRALEQEGAYFAGTLYFQGESDAINEATLWRQSGVMGTISNNWRNGMDVIIETLNTEFGKKPFVFAQLGDYVIYAPGQEYLISARDQFQEMQTEYAAEKQLKMVITKDLPMFDNLHFTSDAQMEIGKRFSTKFKEV